jgi:nucleotide-binding universal stress UspA family protein
VNRSGSAPTTDSRGDAPAVVGIRGSIVVVSAEDDRFRAALDRAADLARAEKRPLILYDWDAPSLLAAPVPTFWSGDGPGERPDGPMDPDELDKAGRARIASQVREYRAHGVPAGGWLPAEPGAEALAAFAMENGASALVVPEDLPGADKLAPKDESGREPHDPTAPGSAIRIIRAPAGQEA